VNGLSVLVRAELVTETAEELAEMGLQPKLVAQAQQWMLR